VTASASLPRLGPAPTRRGVRFRLLAPQAIAATVGIFGSVRSSRPRETYAADRSSDGVWEVEVEGMGVGDLYAWCVDGPPLAGARFDPERCILDPHGWEVARKPTGSRCGLSRVPVFEFDWEGVRWPRILPDRRVICELHAKGATRLHPRIPRSLRGSYAGLARPEVLGYLRGLGVTTLELLPVHARLDEPFLAERGLSNYWGYNTLCWWAPEPALSSDGRGCDEFRLLVREAHRTGLEVVLDVVYNHSCEAGEGGEPVSLRATGSWYRRRTDGGLDDLTGCGNTLDFRLPQVRRLVRESLRHWVEVFRVDGFRFDLAAVHGRMDGVFDPAAPFFRELAADPVLRDRILVAEPWDATSQGYGLGKFPAGWSEWNDRFRDDVRLFWKGEGSGETFAHRLAGSVDLFGKRSPGASVNFVTCHDGFTLRDLCTWSTKRNHANGEGNRDGSDWNHSGGIGPDGESSDAAVLERRAARARGLLASALLARGIPMFLLGDERGRTQGGNNNAYCQDNGISWVDWDAPGPWPDPDWVRAVLELRSELVGTRVAEPWPVEPSRGTGGVVLEGSTGRWWLLGRAAGDREPLIPPPGRWVLRLDTSQACAAVPGPDIERVPGGIESFYVFQSPQVGLGKVKRHKSTAGRGPSG